PMNRRTLAFLTSAVLVLLAPAAIYLAQQTKAPAPATTTRTITAARPQTQAINLMPVDARNAFVKQYCAGCHNDTQKSGGMTLTSLDMAHPEQNGELAEKVIRKLRAGLMPPANAAKKPDTETAKLLITTLETEVDK